MKQFALSKHTQNVNKEWNGPTPFLPGVGDDEFLTTDAIRNIYTQVYDANQTLIGLENVDDHLTMLRKRFDFVDKVHVKDLYDWIVSIRPLVDELAKSKISRESKLVALLSPCENLPCASQPPTDSSMVKRSMCYFLTNKPIQTHQILANILNSLSDLIAGFQSFTLFVDEMSVTNARGNTPLARSIIAQINTGMTRKLKYAVGRLFDFLETTATWLGQCAEAIQLEDNLDKFQDKNGNVKLPGSEKYDRDEDIITMRDMFKLKRTKFHTLEAKEITIRKSDTMGIRRDLAKVVKTF